MKTKHICMGVLSAVWLIASAEAADTYNIDPMHSTVGFSVSHLVINNVKGKFGEFTGTVVVDNGAIKEANGTIQTKSIDTGVAARDKDLRGPNYFDVEKYPTITFKGKRAETKGGQTLLIGDYSMHGMTKELSLPVTLKGPIKDPWGNDRIGLQAKTTLSRKEYGMTKGGPMVGDEIEIEINAEATKAK
jgi:polyisoprenoid-binding protein YceI